MDRSVADRERLRQHLICSALLQLAGLAYTIAYFAGGLPWFGCITAASMALGAIAPYFALRGNSTASAHCATGAFFAAIFTTSFGTGDISEPASVLTVAAPDAERRDRSNSADRLDVRSRLHAGSDDGEPRRVLSREHSSSDGGDGSGSDGRDRGGVEQRGEAAVVGIEEEDGALV